MWKSLFTYGCDIWEEDFEVWEEENGYSCSIEGLIYYDSLGLSIGLGRIALTNSPFTKNSANILLVSHLSTLPGI